LLRRLIVCVALLATLFAMAASSALAAPPPGWGEIDLGTLGGSYSVANDVNDAGKVVGDSATDTGQTHGFAWTQSGGMADLGTLGGTFSSAIAVNAAGQVAGYSTDDADGDVAQHAVRWSATGAIEDIGHLGGGDSTAVAINASGAVTGTSTTATGELHAFYWSGSGAPVDLGTLGGTFSTAIALNAAGQVVGYSTTAGDLTEHAFVWTPGGSMVDITPGAVNGRANGINNAGQVVGSFAPADNSDAQQGFLWQQGSPLVPIGAASTFTTANAISAGGQIVGVIPAAADPTQQRAFTRTPAGAVTELATLGGAYGAAFAVSSTGGVAGSSTIVDDAAMHAFYWASGTLLDMGTLGGSDSFAVAVNASAQVVAFSGTEGGDNHAVVWQRDTTPPVITRTITGTLGQNGWYTSNAVVTWSVTDEQTPITSPACVASTVSADTIGTTFTCSATSGGGTTTQSVTIKRDATPPAVSFAAHPASFSADQTVVIPCTASDATSGLATTCTGVNVAGSLLPLGVNTRTTSATDRAGNTRSVSTTFTITATLPNAPTPSSICQLMQKYVQDSAKYKALNPFSRLVVDVLTTLGCSWVKAITPRMNASQKASLVTSYKNTVTSLLNGGWITAAQAATLRAQVDQL
jgi:probable HAF family extracellular repeat protein